VLSSASKTEAATERSAATTRATYSDDVAEAFGR